MVNTRSHQTDPDLTKKRTHKITSKELKEKNSYDQVNGMPETRLSQKPEPKTIKRTNNHDIAPVSKKKKAVDFDVHRRHSSLLKTYCVCHICNCRLPSVESLSSHKKNCKNTEQKSRASWTGSSEASDPCSGNQTVKKAPTSLNGSSSVVVSSSCKKDELISSSEDSVSNSHISDDSNSNVCVGEIHNTDSDVPVPSVVKANHNDSSSTSRQEKSSEKIVCSSPAKLINTQGVDKFLVKVFGVPKSILKNNVCVQSKGSITVMEKSASVKLERILENPVNVTKKPSHAKSVEFNLVHPSKEVQKELQTSNAINKPSNVKSVESNLVHLSKGVQKKLGSHVIRTLEPVVTLKASDGTTIKKQVIIKEPNKVVAVEDEDASNSSITYSSDDSDDFKGFGDTSDEDQTVSKEQETLGFQYILSKDPIMVMKKHANVIIKSILKKNVNVTKKPSNGKSVVFNLVDVSKEEVQNQIGSHVIDHPVVTLKASDEKIIKKQVVFKEPNKVVAVENEEVSNISGRNSSDDADDFKGFEIFSEEDQTVRKIKCYSELVQQSNTKLINAQNSTTNEDQSIKKPECSNSRLSLPRNAKLRYTQNSCTTVSPTVKTQTEHYFVKDKAYKCIYCKVEKSSISLILMHLQICIDAPLAVIKSIKHNFFENVPTINKKIQQENKLDTSFSPFKALKLGSNLIRGEMLKLRSKYSGKRKAGGFKIARTVANHFYKTPHTSGASLSELGTQSLFKVTKNCDNKTDCNNLENGNNGTILFENDKLPEENINHLETDTSNNYASGVQTLQPELELFNKLPENNNHLKTDTSNSNASGIVILQPELELFNKLPEDNNHLKTDTSNSNASGIVILQPELELFNKLPEDNNHLKTDTSNNNASGIVILQPELELSNKLPEDNNHLKTDTSNNNASGILILQPELELSNKLLENNNHLKADTSNSNASGIVILQPELELSNKLPEIGILQPVTSTEFKNRCPHCSEIICGFKNYSKHLLKHRLKPVNADSTLHLPENVLSKQNNKIFEQESNKRSNWKKAILKNYLYAGNEFSVTSSSSSSSVETCNDLPVINLEEPPTDSYVAKLVNDLCNLKDSSKSNKKSTKDDEKLVRLDSVPPSNVDSNRSHSNCQLEVPNPNREISVIEYKKNSCVANDNLSDDDIQEQGVLCALCNEIFKNDRNLVSHLYSSHLNVTKPSIKRNKNKAAEDENSNLQNINNVVPTNITPGKNVVIRNDNSLQIKGENLKNKQRASQIENPCAIDEFVTSDVINTYSKNKKVVEKENNSTPAVILNRVSIKQIRTFSKINYQAINNETKRCVETPLEETKKRRRVDPEISVMPAESTSISPQPTESCKQCDHFTQFWS